MADAPLPLAAKAGPSCQQAGRPWRPLPHEGVNLASGSFGEGDVLGEDYEYPSTKDIDYFAAHGMNAIRLPVKAKRVLRESSSDLGIVDGLIDHAARRGVTIVLDLHDYGFTASGGLIGREEKATQDFAAQWHGLALRYRNTGNIIFGLMNEPHEQTPQEWLTGVNAAIASIRAVGARQQILVPGTAWDSAWRWSETGNASALAGGIKDPAGNYAFEVHQYLDGSGGGDTTSVVEGSGSAPLHLYIHGTAVRWQDP